MFICYLYIFLPLQNISTIIHIITIIYSYHMFVDCRSGIGVFENCRRKARYLGLYGSIMQRNGNRSFHNQFRIATRLNLRLHVFHISSNRSIAFWFRLRFYKTRVGVTRVCRIMNWIAWRRLFIFPFHRDSGIRVYLCILGSSIVVVRISSHFRRGHTWYAFINVQARVSLSSVDWIMHFGQVMGRDS